MRRLVLEEHKAREDRERTITIAIAIGLIAFVPSIVLGVLLWHEVDTRANANQTLIQEVQRHETEVAKEREEVRKALRAADIQNCREDEVVKSRLRKIVAFDPEAVAFTLEQLGIDPQSQRGKLLTERSKANSDEALRALAPRDCSLLPDPTRPQPG